jgi:hypothetical protein
MWVNKTKVSWRYLPNRYFYSTAFMWSLEYLMKSGLDINGFIKGWKEVSAIPGNEKKHTVSESTLKYLKVVDARLWY